MSSSLRRFVCVSLVLLIMALMLQGLTAVADTQAEKVNLRFSVTQDSGPSFELFKRLVAAYSEEEPNVVVTMEGIPQEYTTKILMEVAAGNAPDLIWIFPEMVPQFAAQNALVNLSDYDGKYFQSADFIAPYINEYTYEGNIYALPGDGATHVLFINRDLFDAAGLQVPTEMTWDALRDCADKLTLRDEAGKVTQWGFAVDTTLNFLYPFVKQNSGDLLNADATATTFSTPEVIETMEFLYSMIYDGVSPAPGWEDSIPNSELFKSGKLGMLFDGAWNCSITFPDAQFNYDIIDSPIKKQKAVMGFSGACAVVATTQHVEEAVKFLSWFNGAEGQKMKFTSGYAGTPSITSLLDTEFGYIGFYDNNHPEVNYNAISEAGKYINSFPSQLFSRLDIIDTINPILNNLANKEIDVPTAAAQIDEIATPMLAQP